MAVNRSKSDGFMLRFPEGMRERIREAAEANGRSMNGEIIARLEDSFEGGGIMAQIADQALLSGLSIGLIESFLAEDDPLAAMLAYRDRKMKGSRQERLSEMLKGSYDMMTALKRLEGTRIGLKDKLPEEWGTPASETSEPKE